MRVFTCRILSRSHKTSIKNPPLGLFVASVSFIFQRKENQKPKKRLGKRPSGGVFYFVFCFLQRKQVTEGPPSVWSLVVSPPGPQKGPGGGERRHNPFLWIVNQTLATNGWCLSPQETTTRPKGASFGYFFLLLL